jgi:uncharacterized FlaG/YvyC family protein
MARDYNANRRYQAARQPVNQGDTLQYWVRKATDLERQLADTQRRLDEALACISEQAQARMDEMRTALRFKTGEPNL